MAMRNRILAGIAILWGGALVVRWLSSGLPEGGSEAYQAGQGGAAVFGALMLVAGLYYFFRRSG